MMDTNEVLLQQFTNVFYKKSGTLATKTAATHTKTEINSNSYYEIGQFSRRMSDEKLKNQILQLNLLLLAL